MTNTLYQFLSDELVLFENLGELSMFASLVWNSDWLKYLLQTVIIYLICNENIGKCVLTSKISLALYIVIKLVGAAGIMIIGIRDDLIFVLAERRASAVERKPRSVKVECAYILIYMINKYSWITLYSRTTNGKNSCSKAKVS